MEIEKDFLNELAEYTIITIEFVDCDIYMNGDNIADSTEFKFNVSKLQFINVNGLLDSDFNIHPFKNIIGLNTLTLKDTPIHVSDSMFSNYGELRNVMLSNSIMKMKDNMFSNSDHIFNSFNIEYNNLTCKDLRKIRGLNSETILWNKGNQITCTVDELTRLNIVTRWRYQDEILASEIDETEPSQVWFVLVVLNTLFLSALPATVYVKLTYFTDDLPQKIIDVKK